MEFLGRSVPPQVELSALAQVRRDLFEILPEVVGTEPGKLFGNPEQRLEDPEAAVECRQLEA